MTAEALKDCNKRHLAQLAKEKGITGWHAMRKDQLIRALSSSRSAPSDRLPRRRRRQRPRSAAPQETGRRAGAGGTAASRARVAPAATARPRRWTMLARKTGSSS